MSPKVHRSLSFIVASVALLSFTFPAGWMKGGNLPEFYEMGIDKGAGQHGNNAATIKSLEPGIDGYGTLKQNIKPDKFFGKKIKLTGNLKCKDVDGAAGLWLRIEMEERIYLDNMNEKMLTGTKDWLQWEMILPVPKETKNIAFGGIVHGGGQLWFEDLKIEIAGDSEKITSDLEGDFPYAAPSVINDVPTNLDFTK